MIYRKLSLFFVFFFFSPPSPSPFCSGKIRETRASPYGSSSYGQDGTDFHDRRIFTAAYYELFPSFPPALSGLSATYDLSPPPLVSCRYLKRRLPISPSPRETETDEEGKEENAVSRWSSPRAVISANVYDRANHVFHLPLFPL